MTVLVRENVFVKSYIHKYIYMYAHIHTTYSFEYKLNG